MRAKAVCQVCPVKSECRDYALTIKEPYGIWGGLTETERRLELTRA
jgi:WhiB family redox-sensing transcriptional regulator